jgi:hypothetical protein
MWPKPSTPEIVKEAFAPYEDGSRNVGFFQNQLTRLIAREDFIEFSRRENFKSYKVKCCSTLDSNWSSSE